MVQEIGPPRSPVQTGESRGVLSLSGELRLYDVAFGTEDGKPTISVTILASKSGGEEGMVFHGDQLVTMADGDGRGVLCLVAGGEVVLRLGDIVSSPVLS